MAVPPPEAPAAPEYPEQYHDDAGRGHDGWEDRDWSDERYLAPEEVRRGMTPYDYITSMGRRWKGKKRKGSAGAAARRGEGAHGFVVGARVHAKWKGGHGARAGLGPARRAQT